MRVLSLSSRRTLSLLRRVVAPFSVLTTRGHTFYFQEVTSFDPTISYGYDVTLLQNWVLSDEEYRVFQVAAMERSFVYDLTDPLLLQIPRVQEQLRYCRVVTVPNAYLEREVKQLAGRVIRLPSCIDFELMMTGRKYGKSDDVRIVGCFGPHDWYLVRDAIALMRDRHPRLVFLGDSFAYKQLTRDLVQKVDSSDIARYPGYLFSCLFGLCPFDGDKGQETIWGLEYGILCKPIVTNKGSLYREVLPDMHFKGKHMPHARYVTSSGDTNAWVEAMEEMLGDARQRSEIGNRAFDAANQRRATKVAGEYLRQYERAIPQLGIG